MKKIISVFLIASILISSVCVFADSSKNDKLLEDKLTVVKSRISDTAEYTEFSANINSFKENSYTCVFTWETKEPYKRLEVTINNEDIITRYYKSTDTYSGNTPIFEYKSNDEIIAAAKNHFELLNPQLKDKFVFEAEEYADLYSDYFMVYGQRIENGLDVHGNNCNITLSKDLSELINMNLYYNDIENFEDTSFAVDYDNAIEAYKEKLGYKLVYDFNNISGQRSAALKYIPKYSSDEYIDALNGDVFNYSEYAEDLRASVENSASDKLMSGGGGGGANFSAAEISEINKIENLLSVEEITDILKDNQYLEIPSESKVSYSRLNKDYFDDECYLYYIDFEHNDEFCYVTCNAKTGEVIRFNRYFERDFNNALSEIEVNELHTKAEAAAKGLASEYFTNDQNNSFAFRELDNPTGSVDAYRVVNGVECLQNGLSLGLDKYSGKISFYNITYYDVDFPDPAEAIGYESAYESLFKSSDYSLKYIPVINENGTYNGKLVYDFDIGNLWMDANTGKLLYSLTEEKEKITDYIDIEGHYAQEVINKLAKFGIGFTGGEFKPNEVIKQGEFVLLLSYVFRRHGTPIIYKSGTDFSFAYNYIRSNEIIAEEDINKDAEVSREDACVMMIKAMNYEDVASYDHIFVSSFDDVEQNLGYITILNAMNVISGDGNGKFNPKLKLTRADAILMLYNYLTK